jgi:hypothetical protein
MTVVEIDDTEMLGCGGWRSATTWKRAGPKNTPHPRRLIHHHSVIDFESHRIATLGAYLFYRNFYVIHT